MSVEIWPPISSEQLKDALESTQVGRCPSFHHYIFSTKLLSAMATDISSSWILVEPYSSPPSKQNRELDWLVEELRETLTNLKHGLEDCYALLAPIDPGSTLVLSTPRNEIVKGTITRVGTRIVKGVC